MGASNSLHCPKCGAPVSPEVDFCPRCGRDLRPRNQFPWVASILAFVVGAAVCVVVGLIAGVGNSDTVTVHDGGKQPAKTVTAPSNTHVTVSQPTHTATQTETTTATVSTTATSTTTVSTTKTVTAGG